MNRAKKYVERIKDIQEKYPHSMMAPPLVISINYVDSDGQVFFEDLGDELSLLRSIDKYEEMAKESNERSLRIKEATKEWST